MSSGGAALQPTFQGHVATTQDALILFEACLQGHLSHVPRRPHDRERSSLIRSGSIFIYEENASGIKRWTDGVTWSPSRILGNFLVYRELDKPFPPGEKKRAMKKQQRRPSRPGDPYSRPEGEIYSPTTPQGSFGGGGGGGGGGGDRSASEVERQLIGSLIDSYGFKQDGLVKKTMSVTVQGVTHHLVSYYNVNDVIANNLRTPSQTDNLQYIRPRPELTSKQSFRSPLEEVDDMEGLRDSQGAYGYRMGSQPYIQDYKTQPYYHVPQQYSSMNQQQSSGYGVNVPPLQSSYMHQTVPSPQIPQAPRNEYGYDQGAYNRGYESMQSKSIPPTPTGQIPPMMPDRSASQSMMYPPSNMQQNMQRPLTSPVPIDTRSDVPYRPSPYPMTSSASQIDPHRQPQQSPLNMKYEDRRDTNQHTSQMYASPRAPYYDGSSQHMQQPQYGQGPPQMGQWSSSSQTAQ